MSKKTKDLPLRIIKPPLDVALEELKKQQEQLQKHEANQIVNSSSTVDSAVTTAVSSDKEERPKKEKKHGEKESRFTFEYLDATHTSAEAKVYSVMYRECIAQNTNQLRFGLTQLKEKTGLSDKTIRIAIHSLEEKLSIKTTAPSEGIYGRKFHVFSPKEILTARRKAGIEIEPHTKKIISKSGSAVATAVASAVKSTAVSAVKSTAVSAVKSTALSETTPYISKNIINRDDSIKNIESSSKSSSNTDDTDDESFDHRVYIISLYEKYTGNRWSIGDEEFYENENLKEILPEVIEAAIIASLLRSKTKINSFAYCEGAIEEFQENLPLGYLSYLRETWRERKGRRTTKDENLITE